MSHIHVPVYSLLLNQLIMATAFNDRTVFHYQNPIHQPRCRQTVRNNQNRPVFGSLKQKTAYAIRPCLVGSEMCIRDRLYNLPFNMNTFSKMWNIKTPQEAKDMIAKQVAETGITEPKNLEEQGLSLVGKDVFEKLVKGYTEKQWGRACKDLPAFIIKR